MFFKKKNKRKGSNGTHEEKEIGRKKKGIKYEEIVFC